MRKCVQCVSVWMSLYVWWVLEEDRLTVKAVDISVTDLLQALRREEIK